MDNPNLLDNSKEVEVPTNLTCEICIEPMTHINKFKNLERCVHPFCRDCIAKYIEAKVEERVAEVPCPSLNCEKLLDPLSCRRIIPAGLFEKWCDLLCESAVLRCKSAYCPFVNCLVLILNECGGNITRSKCPNCKKLLCFQCKLPWHAGFGCDETGEMRNENDILFGKLVERNKWKICPGCKYRVERNKGCQNIKCRCGVLFCYTCGKIKNSCECCRRIVMVEAEEQDGHMRNGGGVNVRDDTRRNFLIDGANHALLPRIIGIILLLMISAILIGLMFELIRMKRLKVARILAKIIIILCCFLSLPCIDLLFSFF